MVRPVIREPSSEPLAMHVARSMGVMESMSKQNRAINGELIRALGHVIRSAREMQGLKSLDIAQRIEISPSVYCRLERGDAVLTVPRLLKIAEILKTSASDLMRDAEQIIEGQKRQQA